MAIFDRSPKLQGEIWSLAVATGRTEGASPGATMLLLPALNMVGFAAVMAGAVNVIIDLEYPRMGLIRVDTFDQALVDLRAGMN